MCKWKCCDELKMLYFPKSNFMYNSVMKKKTILIYKRCYIGRVGVPVLEFKYALLFWEKVYISHYLIKRVQQRKMEEILQYEEEGVSELKRNGTVIYKCLYLCPLRKRKGTWCQLACQLVCLPHLVQLITQELFAKETSNLVGR